MFWFCTYSKINLFIIHFLENEPDVYISSIRNNRRSFNESLLFEWNNYSGTKFILFTLFRGKPNVKPTRGNLLGYAFKDSLCVFGFVFKIGTSRVFGVIIAILPDGPNPSPKIVQKQSNNLYSHFLYICILWSNNIVLWEFQSCYKCIVFWLPLCFFFHWNVEVYNTQDKLFLCHSFSDCAINFS